MLCVLAFACVLALGAVQVTMAQSDAAEPSDNPSANPIVNVGHFAPFGADVAGTSVTVRINGSDVFTSFTYPNVVKGIDILPPGTYTVEVLPTGTATVAISTVVSLQADKKYTLLAIGDGANQPLKLEALDDTIVPPPAGSGLVRIGHYAPFAASLDATRVDICNDATGAPVPNLTNVPYGANSGFLPIPAGVYDLSISIAGSNCVTQALDLDPLAVVAGKVYDVYAIGKGEPAFPLAVTSITGLDTPASVTVGHFAPFAANVAGTSVDIKVNGSLAFTQVVFGQFVPNVALLPGPTLVEILPAGTSTVALSGTFVLSGGLVYDLFAIGGANNQPLAFSASVLDQNPPAGKAFFTIGHLAPFALNADATAVDICTDAGAPVPGLTNVKYPTVAGNLALDPGLYNLKITIAGSNCSALALDLPPFVLEAGEVYDAFAIGTLTDAFPLEVVSTTGLSSPPRVTVAHFAPFASDEDGTIVDIKINGQLALENVKYGAIVPKVPLAPGPTLIEILPDGQSLAVLSATVDLELGKLYSVFAIGGANSQPLELLAREAPQSAPPGKAILTVGHLAPFAANIDDTAVDICTDSGTPVPGLTGVKYPQIADLTLDPGSYDLKITVAGSNCATTALDLPRFRLFAGDIADAYAIGSNLTATPFRVGVATTTGLYFVDLFLPIIRDNAPLLK
jgi:hypothetical protein